MTSPVPNSPCRLPCFVRFLIPARPTRPAHHQLLPGAVVRSHASGGADGGGPSLASNADPAPPRSRRSSCGSISSRRKCGPCVRSWPPRRPCPLTRPSPHRLRTPTTSAAAHDHDEGDASPAENRWRAPSQQIHWFSDVGFVISDRKAATSSFGLGQLDLFLTSKLSDQWTVLSEIVFRAGSDNRFAVTPSVLLCTTSRPTGFRLRWAASTRRSATKRRLPSRIVVRDGGVAPVDVRRRLHPVPQRGVSSRAGCRPGRRASR